MKMPFKCPICDGVGQVPGGYYTRVGVNTWSSTTVSEPCRSCNGSGIVLVEQDVQETHPINP